MLRVQSDDELLGVDLVWLVVGWVSQPKRTPLPLVEAILDTNDFLCEKEIFTIGPGSAQT